MSILSSGKNCNTLVMLNTKQQSFLIGSWASKLCRLQLVSLKHCKKQAPAELKAVPRMMPFAATESSRSVGQTRTMVFVRWMLIAVHLFNNKRSHLFSVFFFFSSLTGHSKHFTSKTHSPIHSYSREREHSRDTGGSSGKVFQGYKDAMYCLNMERYRTRWSTSDW